MTNINVDELVLPKPSCASYIRRDELKTINTAHKAIVLCGEARTDSLNTDGTIKTKEIGWYCNQWLGMRRFCPQNI